MCSCKHILILLWVGRRGVLCTKAIYCKGFVIVVYDDFLGGIKGNIYRKDLKTDFLNVSWGDLISEL